jgi:hypothetical protein
MLTVCATPFRYSKATEIYITRGCTKKRNDGIVRIIMAQVDRETVVPLDPTIEVSDIHDRFRDVAPAFRERLGELAVTGATPAEKLGIRETRDRLAGIELLAKAAITAIDETDIEVRKSPEEALAGDKAYAAVLEFVDVEGGGFTLAQLKDYLRDLGYELPKDARAFSRQFADWQQRILDEKTNPKNEEVPPEKRRWIRLKGRKHVLAWLEVPPAKSTPKHKSEPVPAQPSSSPRQAAAGSVTATAAMPDAEPSASEPPAESPPTRRPDSPGGPATLAEEAAANAAALNLVREASGEPAKILVGRLVQVLNVSTPVAREVFGRLVEAGLIYRHNGGGRVRYSIEAPELTSPAVAATTEPAMPTSESGDEAPVEAAQQVLAAFTGRGLSFGTSLSPQEIARKIAERDEAASITLGDVKAAANYLWSLGFLTRIEARGRLKLQLADRSIMTGSRTEQGRVSLQELIASGKTFTPSAPPTKRRAAKKRR